MMSGGVRLLRGWGGCYLLDFLRKCLLRMLNNFIRIVFTKIKNMMNRVCVVTVNGEF